MGQLTSLMTNCIHVLHVDNTLFFVDTMVVNSIPPVNWIWESFLKDSVDHSVPEAARPYLFCVVVSALGVLSFLHSKQFSDASPKVSPTASPGLSPSIAPSIQPPANGSENQHGSQQTSPTPNNNKMKFVFFRVAAGFCFLFAMGKLAECDY